MASSPLTPVWLILVQGQKEGDKECDLHLCASLECQCNPVFKSCEHLTASVTFSNLAVLLGEGDFCDLDLVSPSERALSMRPQLWLPSGRDTLVWFLWIFTFLETVGVGRACEEQDYHLQTGV